MTILLFLFYFFVIRVARCSNPWFLQYITTENCVEKEVTYTIPLFSDSDGNYTLCTSSLSDEITVKIIVDVNQNQKLFIEEYFNTSECVFSNLIRSNTFQFGVCNSNHPDSIFQNSIFSIRSEAPGYINGLENEKEYFQRKSYGTQSNCHGNGDYIETYYTNRGIGSQSIVFRCNISCYTTSLPQREHQGNPITKLQKFITSTCYEESDNSFSRYECTDKGYFKHVEEELSKDEFMIVNIYEGTGCSGDIKWQDIIRNGLCFELVSEYQLHLFQSLIKDSIGMKYHPSYSVRELYEEESNTLYFGVYNNSNCFSSPFFGRTFHPECNDFRGGESNTWLSEHMFSDFEKYSLIQEKGRITIFQTEDCHKSRDIKIIVKEVVLDRDFDFITSVSQDTCINSFFEFYTGNNTSMFGICNSENEAMFELFKSSDHCQHVSSRSYGSTCLSDTNHGSSAWYTCVPFFCYGFSQFEDDVVCNGNGQCVEDNTCDCSHSWYYGKECNVNGLAIFFPVLGSVFLLLLIFCCCVCCVLTLISLLITTIIFFVGVAGSGAFFRMRSRGDSYKEYFDSMYSRLKDNRSPSLFMMNRPLIDLENKRDFTRFEGDSNGFGRIFQTHRHGKKNRMKTECLVFAGHFKDGKREGRGTEYFLPDFSEDGSRKPSRNSIRASLNSSSSSSSSLNIIKHNSFTSSSSSSSLLSNSRKKFSMGVVKFEGTFHNDLRHGPGIEYSIINEKTLRGVYNNGEIVRIEGDFIDIPRCKISDFEFNFVEDKLGSGSGGDVFSVMFEGRPAALKILRSGMGIGDRINMPQVHQRFARSMKIWSKISHHPYILDLFAWTGLEVRTLGYVSEKCEKSLHDALILGEFSWEEKVKVFYEVAVGMQYLHSSSIMHRDLKIGNILLDSLGCVKICDFDFSRHDDITWKDVSQVSVLGTPAYVAPEVMKGSVYSKMCDIYSFGILAYCTYFEVINPFWNTNRCVCGKELSTERNYIHLHVAECGLKPLIDPDKVKSHEWIITELILPSLSSNPDDRPSFEELIQSIQKNNIINRKKKKKNNNNIRRARGKSGGGSGGAIQNLLMKSRGGDDNNEGIEIIKELLDQGNFSIPTTPSPRTMSINNNDSNELNVSQTDSEL